MDSARTFTLSDLATACQNFSNDSIIGEGGFGRVYKGTLQSGQVVAIKQLNLDGRQGSQEFNKEILMLTRLQHNNLVTLIGCCSCGDEKLLVYEFMPMGSLEDYIFDIDKEPLSWATRLKIAIGVCHGLQYLHCEVDPPVIHRDLKPANILLDNDLNAKLSDFGLAREGPVGDNTHVTTRVLGTHGYCAPEYARTGKLRMQSDIYGLGVVLLELFTGRKAIDYSRIPEEQCLVVWFKQSVKDKIRFSNIVDPILQGQVTRRHLRFALWTVASCLEEDPHARPLITSVVEALEYLAAKA